ncbi:MAG: hypothetical protein WKF43_11720, partial [Acidimicrobiales bacterium]
PGGRGGGGGAAGGAGGGGGPAPRGGGGARPGAQPVVDVHGRDPTPGLDREHQERQRVRTP